jgi:hypothetical protein
MIATEQSVIAQTNEAQSYEEGDAAAAMSPGHGCFITEDADGNKTVNLAGKDENTARVVREQRNPPRSLGTVGDSPLDDAYATGDNTETVLFRRGDRARLRISGDAGTDVLADDEVGWGSDGGVTDDTVGVAIGRVRRVISRTGDDLAVVEFY